MSTYWRWLSAAALALACAAGVAWGTARAEEPQTAALVGQDLAAEKLCQP